MNALPEYRVCELCCLDAERSELFHCRATSSRVPDVSSVALMPGPARIFFRFEHGDTIIEAVSTTGRLRLAVLTVSLEYVNKLHNRAEGPCSIFWD